MDMSTATMLAQALVDGTFAPTAAAAAPAAAAPTGAIGAGTGAALMQTAGGGAQGAVPLAEQVLQAVQAGGARVQVIPDAQFTAQYGRAEGIFDPATNAISIPQHVAQNPDAMSLVLLHEGTHWLQHNVPGGLEALGGPVAQALQGAGATTVQVDPNSKAASQQDEAQAYLLEALAANQLGIKDPGLGTDPAGRIRDYAAIKAEVLATPEYA
jgi:hypothetical protein